MTDLKVRGQRVDNAQWVYGYYYEIPAPPQPWGEQGSPKGYIILPNPNYYPDWNMPWQMVQAEVIRESVTKF